MLPICFTTLIVLALILILIRKEESLERKSIIQGIANKYWPVKERRRFVRFEDNIRIRYNILPNKVMFRHSKSINISQRGLCLLTYEKLKLKSNLDLELEIPTLSKPLSVRGRVAWVKNLQSQDKEGRRLFYIGVQLYSINPKTESLLLDHLSTLKPC
ncbi:MAG: PilZ domain-containing protein [Candidatus Omnitrophota bacterium]